MQPYSLAMVISTWDSMATWFTPIILFCFLNLMIGSIFLASKFKIQINRHQLGEHNSNQLARAPYLLARVKSINLFHNYTSRSETQFTDPVQDYRQTERENENHGPEQHQLARTPSLLARVKSINWSHNDSSQSENQFTDPVQDYHQKSESESESENENHGPEQNQLGEHNSPQLARAPSLLARVKSPVQDYHRTESESESESESDDPEQHQLGESNSTQLARVKSINLSHNHPSQYETQITGPVQDYHHNDEIESENEIENHGPELNRHVTRSKSEACEEATAERVPAKMRKSAKLRKSASVKLAVGGRVERKEEVELRRPATVRERKSKVSETEEEEGGVDEKADDFINMFKKQLKLQRVDSLLRYNEMLSRGSSDVK